MKRPRSLAALVLAAAAGGLGCGAGGPLEDRSGAGAGAELRPYPLPEHRVTYEYRFVQAEPESLLSVLCDAGIPVRQAWLPLENECMDPRGPAFTVELARDDERMGKFDFIRGNGRLECAPRLQHYPGC